MKDAYYFSHDFNARNDQRLVKVRMQYGMEGYGIYFGIIEILRETQDYTLEYTESLESIAFDLRVDIEIVQDIITNYNLFVIDGDVFYSRSLKRRLECLDKKKQIRVEAGRKGGKVTQAKAKQKSSIAKAVKKSKVNKSKVNNIKDIKSLKSINKEYLNELQKLHTDIDVVFQFDKFKNWLDAKGKSYKDYRAAFRNWLTSAWCEKTNHTINKKLHFKMPDGRNYLGYCSKCLKSDFYEPFNFNPDVVESKCCNSAILNERPVSA